MTTPSELKAYIASLKNINEKDDGAFRAVVARGMDVLQLLDSDLAHQFGVSRPTVTRWRNGANAPHPAMRKPVFAWLKGRASALLNREPVAADR